MNAIPVMWANDSNAQHLVTSVYSCCMKQRPDRRGGDIAIYVDEVINYGVYRDLNDCISTNFELRCVQIDLACGRKNIVTIYRPPNSCLEGFINEY